MASIPGFRFDITGASGSQGLLSPKDSWRAYIFPRGGYAKQDSTGTLITFDSADVASRFAVNNWIQVGLDVDTIDQVAAVGGNSISIGSAATVSENDRIFIIGNTEPTVTGGSATYTTPDTIIRERDDDGADVITNSMITSDSNGLIQGFAEANLYDVLIQDGNQTNQGSIINMPVGVVEGVSVSQSALFGATVTFNGAVGITGTLTVGTSAGLTAATTQSQGQGALTADVNEISTCANQNDTVTLPAALAGRRCVVINNGDEWLQIYPASSDAILPNSADTPVVLPNGQRLEFVSYDGTSWKPSPRPGPSAINVLDYGAKADGSTDDSTAIKTAISDNVGAADYPTVHVYMPTGIYIVTEDVFSGLAANENRRGLMVTGDGWWNSIIRYGTLAAETWLYDNSADEIWQFVEFRDLHFQGADPDTVSANSDIPANANGFKITSAANEQSFVFRACEFSALIKVLQTEGTNTASEMKFIGCKLLKIGGPAFLISNAQSFNHEFISCDIEGIWGDIFEIEAGGAIKAFGGSWIIDDNQDESPATTQNWVLNLNNAGVAALGLNSTPIVFSGVRLELRGEETGIITDTNSNSGAPIAFDNCLFLSTEATGDREVVVVRNFDVVNFDNCVFKEQAAGQIQFNFSYSTNTEGIPGRINFSKCYFPANDWATRVTWDNAAVGRATARWCYGPTGVVSSEPLKYATDFDLDGTTGTGSADTTIDLKHAILVASGQSLPIGDTTTKDKTLFLPQNSVIRGMYFTNGGGTGGCANNIQYHLTTNTKGTSYGATAEAAQNTDHELALTNLFVDVAGSSDTQTVRLSATPAGNTHSTITGGICVVEYY